MYVKNGLKVKLKGIKLSWHKTFAHVAVNGIGAQNAEGIATLDESINR